MFGLLFVRRTLLLNRTYFLFCIKTPSFKNDEFEAIFECDDWFYIIATADLLQELTRTTTTDGGYKSGVCQDDIY